MRLRTVTLMAALLCAVLFSGCTTEDEKSFDYDLNLLYGKWRVTEINASGGWIDVTTYPGNSEMEPTYATFNSNGTYSGSGAFGSGAGTYSAVGSTVITYIEGKEFMRYEVISLTSSRCELMMKEGKTSLRMRCQKQSDPTTE